VNQADWRELLAHITPVNVAKWVLVVGFAVFAIIALSWFAAFAWGTS
jgi:hypothetical protein